MDEYRETVINAKVFANEFHKLCKNFRPPVKESDARINYLIATYNENIIDFLVRIKNCMDKGRCDSKTFKEQVIKINSSKLLDIEIWWYLEKCGVMRDEDFYQMFDSNDCCHITEYFSKCLCKSIIQEYENSPFRKNMNCDLIELCLNHKKRCDNKNIDSAIYNNFFNAVGSCINTDNNQYILSVDLVLDILKNTSVEGSIIKLFILDLIKVLLQGETMVLQDAIHKTEHFIKDSTLIVKKNLKLFDFLDEQDIITHLKQILIKTSMSVNWQNLFYLLSYVTSYCDDSLKHIKSLIQCLLDDALENSNKSSLLYVFVVARYCSFPKVPNFPSYVNWFSSTFSSESSRPINTKEKAVFFMEFLNETVTYESPYCLKVHINRAPSLPMDCQSLLFDYVQIVKTRLIDMNESTELGLFDNVSTITSAEFDVETVLNIFSNTNEVPKCVLEASLFCRSYYEKKFLVTLLSKYEGKNTVRHKLITKLQSLGKIPNSLFLSYKQLI